MPVADERLLYPFSRFSSPNFQSRWQCNYNGRLSGRQERGSSSLGTPDVAMSHPCCAQWEAGERSDSPAWLGGPAVESRRDGFRGSPMVEVFFKRHLLKESREERTLRGFRTTLMLIVVEAGKHPVRRPEARCYGGVDGALETS